MSDSKPDILSCILYEEKVKHSDYEMVKIEVEMPDGSLRKRNLPRFSGDKGVEGLFYVLDEFINQAAMRLNFQQEDYWIYWPDLLDPVARRKWTLLNEDVRPNQRTRARFNRAISDFVNQYAGNNNPRDDLIRYLQSDECKKPRKVSPDDHATRIETLCMYANRLTGTEAELTEERINLLIFNSFPEPWKRDFVIGRGRPENETRREILEYMNLRKTYADVDETKFKKRKNDKNETTSNKKKQTGKNNEKNVCRHHGTHLWSECSLNPQSKNYHMNPRSPFYRGGRGNGRGDGGRGGRFSGRGGRGSDYSGRGGMPPQQQQQQQYFHQGGGSRSDNYYNDRGNDLGQDRGSSGSNNNNYHYNHNHNGGDADRQYDSMRSSYHNHNNYHGRGSQQW